MTIETLNSVVDYTTSGATTEFPVTFPFGGKVANLVVFVAGAQKFDWTLVAANVVPNTPSAWVGAVLIRRAVPLTQTDDYRDNDKFPAETLEAGMDKVTMILQQHDEALSRALRLSDTLPPLASPILPTPVAGKAIGWNATADGLANLDAGIGPQGPAGATGPQGPAGAPGAGTGDVVGPASATDNAVAKFDGTTGKILKDGVVLGTAATLNVGTGANQVVQLNGSSQLPAVSGALLTNLPSAVNPTGTMTVMLGTAAPSGYVRANGLTIGNAASSGSERANADTSALFTHLWDNFSNTLCPVSGGRGANAAADFAANKNITLPDLRGRLVIGLDTMGGTAANRSQASTTISTTSGSPTATVASATNITIGMTIYSTNVPAGTTVSNIIGTTVTMSGNATATAGGIAARFSALANDPQVPGATGGLQAVTLVTAQTPAHTHPSGGTLDTVPSTSLTGVDANVVVVDQSPTDTLAIGGTTGSIGGGQAHPSMPPVYAATPIIKL